MPLFLRRGENYSGVSPMIRLPGGVFVEGSIPKYGHVFLRSKLLLPALRMKIQGFAISISTAKLSRSFPGSIGLVSLFKDARTFLKYTRLLSLCCLILRTLSLRI